ncbi:head maturation protease, ClpP-related [Lysinibacillus sp. KU-BSD001]|uniref:head maturation protease, ClpP-related n=1 Tax=Lysinibacillus sp. KU-BSD001 TaxID=3141328 RepID=UPI0036DFD853
MHHSIEIYGHIVSDPLANIYRAFGIKCTSPIDIISGLEKAAGAPVDLIINSGGGDAFVGVEIYSRLKAYSGQLKAKVYSLAASAASIIAMGADSILISPGGQIMIHNVSISHAAGDVNALSKTVNLLKNFDQSLANIYIHKTGKTLAEVLALMDKETWFTASEAIKQGFADGLLFYNKEVPEYKKTTEQKTSNVSTVATNQSKNAQSDQMRMRLNQLKDKQFAADATELERAKAKLNLLKMKKVGV